MTISRQVIHLIRSRSALLQRIAISKILSRFGLGSVGVWGLVTWAVLQGDRWGCYFVAKAIVLRNWITPSWIVGSSRKRLVQKLGEGPTLRSLA